MPATMQGAMQATSVSAPQNKTDRMPRAPLPGFLKAKSAAMAIADRPASIVDILHLPVRYRD
jgi:hypothetical protein